MRPLKTAFLALLGPAAFAAVLACASSAAAATYTVKVLDPLDIGTVIAAVNGDTSFLLDPASGNVSLLSGGGRRVTATAVRARVTIKCAPSRGGDLTCDTDNVNVRINTSGTPTGRARNLTNFTVSMDTTTLIEGPNGTDPLTFRLAPIGTNQTKQFYLGATFAVAGDDSGLASGNGINGFTANTVNLAGTVTAADSDQGKVKAFRSVSITKTSDLSFGMIGRPKTGNGNVTVANGGNRTVTGTGSVAYPSPAPTAANFTIGGEGGQVVSLSVPTSLVLTAPGGPTINVALTRNPSGATTSLNSSLGNAGTKVLQVGGSFPMSATTTTGAYTGLLTVNVDYN